MSTTVTYKGATLTTVDNATVTLETAGKYCEDDFTLTDVSGGGGVQTAYVDGLEASGILYYTDANMTAQSGRFIYGAYLPLGTLVFVYNNGPALPFPPTGLTKLVEYTAGLNSYIVYEVTG